MRVTSAQRLARFLAAAGIEPSVVGDGQVPVGPDVGIDNRAATAGSLFIGLPGERVDGANLVVDCVGRGIEKFQHDGTYVTIQMATFQGVLEVRDPARLRACLVGGMGRSKAYGCGLMTLARP